MNEVSRAKVLLALGAAMTPREETMKRTIVGPTPKSPERLAAAQAKRERKLAKRLQRGDIDAVTAGGLVVFGVLFICALAFKSQDNTFCTRNKPIADSIHECLAIEQCYTDPTELRLMKKVAEECQ